MARISALIWFSVTFPVTPSSVTTWKYTGTVARKLLPPLPCALAGTSSATCFSDGSDPPPRAHTKHPSPASRRCCSQRTRPPALPPPARPPGWCTPPPPLPTPAAQRVDGEVERTSSLLPLLKFPRTGDARGEEPGFGGAFNIVDVIAQKATLTLAETFTISRGSEDEADVVHVAISHRGQTGYGEAAP